MGLGTLEVSPVYELVDNSAAWEVCVPGPEELSLDCFACNKSLMEHTRKEETRCLNRAGPQMGMLRDY